MERTPRVRRRWRKLYLESIKQLHAAHYRAPEQLPDGGVLVVGSAQSGYQIAEELLASGRRLVLATSPVGRAPARHRGRDTVAWLVEYGFFDQRPQDLADPATVQRPQPLLAPGGRSASLHTLARAGATLTGRLITVAGTRLSFDDTLAANLALADRYAADIRTLLDQTIPPEALTVPIEPDDADTPVPIDLVAARLTCSRSTSAPWCGPPATPATSPGCPSRCWTAPAFPARRRRGAGPGPLVRRAALADPAQLREPPRIPHRCRRDRPGRPGLPRPWAYNDRSTGPP